MPKMTKAKKNHGKCGFCPNDIEPGNIYIKRLRDATLAEIEDESVKTPFLWGSRKVEEKIHLDCMKQVVRSRNERSSFRTGRSDSSGTQSLGNLLP